MLQVEIKDVFLQSSNAENLEIEVKQESPISNSNNNKKEQDEGENIEYLNEEELDRNRESNRKNDRNLNPECSN